MIKKIITAFLCGMAFVAPTILAASTSFSDVKSGDKFYSSILNVADWGVMRGNGDGSFGAGKNVTRGELADVLSKYDRRVDQKIPQGIKDYISAKMAEAVPVPTSPDSIKRVSVSADDDAYMGKKNAPVTIIEFSDFQCPFCQRFVTDTLPQIKSDYIDKGKVKLVYRDFPLSFHENARPAAIAAECVKTQAGNAAFFKFHDLVFANQASLSKDNLKIWATGIAGVNKNAFNSCFDNEKTGAEVDKDFADGQTAGVNGTPSFFINGRFLSGAQPYASFQTMIDQELKK